MEEGGTAEICRDDPGILCHDACFESADFEAITLYDQWVRCLADACGGLCSPVAGAQDCIDCALSNCQAETLACYDDGAAP
jgi:hypothetical protein